MMHWIECNDSIETTAISNTTVLSSQLLLAARGINKTLKTFICCIRDIVSK